MIALRKLLRVLRVLYPLSLERGIFRTPLIHRLCGEVDRQISAIERRHRRRGAILVKPRLDRSSRFLAKNRCQLRNLDALGIFSLAPASARREYCAAVAPRSWREKQDGGQAAISKRIARDCDFFDGVLEIGRRSPSDRHAFLIVPLVFNHVDDMVI